MIETDDAERRLFQSRMIDVGRGLAILLVLVVHVGQVLGSPVFSPISSNIAWALGFLTFGGAGVGLFFVISGFLINMLYSKPEFSQKKFWIRRFARIYPAWLLWTGIAIVATIVPKSPLYLGENFYGLGIMPDSVPHVLEFLAHLLFLGFLVPMMWNTFIPGGWSIQAEMFNYLLYTIFRRMIFTHVIAVVMAVEIVQAIVMSSTNIITSHLQPSFIFQTYMTSPMWFVVGMYLSRLAKRVPGLAMESSLIVCAIGLAVILRLNGAFVAQATTAAVVAASIGLCYLAVRYDRWKRLVLIGKYSYGIYFSHFLFLPVLGWVAKLLVDHVSLLTAKLLALPVLILGYLVVLICSLIVAIIIFKLVERHPIERARKRS